MWTTFMRRLRKLSCLLLLGFGPFAGTAADLDTIGVTLLWQVDPFLRGDGVPVALAEAASTNGGTDFEVNPVVVNQPPSLFTYFSAAGTASTFPNNVGTESTHANRVAGNFFGATSGVAPHVSHVDNYEAERFANYYIVPNRAIQARVVNQSFSFGTNQQSDVDRVYDNYAINRGTLFVSVVGNGGPVTPPGTAYNGISVGVVGFPSSVGPSHDGRCKPELVAPAQTGGANSFSAPYVAGAAAVLLQAGARGDGGADITAAQNLRTVKALLINGAVKPANWTNNTTRPLDLRYGSGVLNAFNSWSQLRGGKRPFIESTTAAQGQPHPPGANAGNVAVHAGWDQNSIATPSGTDMRINHYYFALTGTNEYTLTATLVWNRQEDRDTINNLDLYLYDAETDGELRASISTVDNVEHLYVPRLAPGRYDLQVLKRRSGQVSNSETYALAFEFSCPRLGIAPSDNSVVLSWPLAPAGFRVQSSPYPGPLAIWSNLNLPSTVDTNRNLNVLTIPATQDAQFFRMVRP
jgi:hypothetical protein